MPRMSYADYKALERSSPERHEFLRGEVCAIGGGSPSHSFIAANIAVAFGQALKGKPCSVFTSDLRVRVVETDRTTSPDVTVVCGKRQLAPDDEDAVTNPVLIVEVLSDSTEASDRGEKFAHLQRLASLQEYVLVSQHGRRIEVFRRSESPTWTLIPHTEGRVELKSVAAALDMADVYADPTA
ncbi:MAG: Uma2 family endonuclease [Deltaproteobacteria bacterium]|nr:Uma2 family endonuclease [Deltaproteobacteria bacterium]